MTGSRRYPGLRRAPAAALLSQLRGGPAAAALYATIALLTFPTLETLRYGMRAPSYALDVFDADGAVPRIGATLTQLADLGPSLWDPRIATGLPTLGHGAIAPIAPDVLIGLLAGPFVAYVLVAWALAFAAGWGMHRFLRDSANLPVAACLLGGFVFLFSFWHYVYGFAAVITPWVLLAGDRLARRGGRRAVALLVGVAVVALGAYAGNSQVTILVCGLHLGWALVGSTAGSLRRRLAAWLVIWGLGLALYLPVLLSQMALLPVSNKTLWDVAHLFDSRPAAALARTLRFYASFLFGTRVAGLGLSPAFYGTYFTGALGIFLLGIMAVFGRSRRAARFTILCLLAIPIIDWAFVVALPNLEAIGFLKSFQVVRVRHLVPFVVALGVAIGAARGLALARLRWTRRTSATALGLAAAVSVLVGFQAIVGARVALAGSGTRWVAIGQVALFAALVTGLVALGLALIVTGRARQRAPVRGLVPAVLVLLLLLAGGERMLYAHAERLTGGHIDTWENRLALTSAQAAIFDLGGSDPGRTLTLADEPNRMAFHGLDQVDGYVAAYPRAYHELFGALIEPCLDADPATGQYFEGWGQRFYAFCPDIDPEVLDLLGVRWISARGEQLQLEGLVERFRDGELRLYENPDAFPHAFLVGGAELVPDEAVARERLASADRETLAGTAIVSRDATADELPDAPGSAGTATVVRSEGDLVEILASADRAAILVLADVVYPDWQAELDGQAATIFPVDVGFRGVVVAPGEHRIVFRYQPVGTYAGFVLAAAALVVTILAALGLARRERRRPR